MVLSDELTVSACVQRLLESFPLAAGTNYKTWAQEMGMLFAEHSPQACRDATTELIRGCKRLPSVAAAAELLGKNETRVETVKRYAEYKPTEIERRYVREDQTREERTQFLKATLAKNGWKQIGDALK